MNQNQTTLEHQNRTESKLQTQTWKTKPPSALSDADGLIFDIDGTLWDSTEAVAKAWNLALSDCIRDGVFSAEGIPHLTAEMLRREFGKPMDEIFRDLLPAHASAHMDALSHACYAHQDEVLEKEGGHVYPGVRKTLETLAFHYPLYIVSNCQLGYVERFYACTGLEDFFRSFLCFGDTHLQKGGTMRMLIGREHLKNPAYIGDIRGDAIASAEAGAAFVWASYGFGEVPSALYAKKIADFSELSCIFTKN